MTLHKYDCLYAKDAPLNSCSYTSIVFIACVLEI